MEIKIDILKDVLDMVPSAVAVYTLDSRLVFCNRAFADTYGTEAATPEGMGFLQVGRRQYYRISRLPEATEQFRKGKKAEQSDVYAGKRRTYSLLEGEGDTFVLEMIVSFSAPMLPVERDEGKDSPDDMILSDKKMKSTVETIRRISNFDSTVLITGESGTGKPMLAKYIHATSKRASAPFVTINCASIPENLIESELFGYVSGAFTGAGQKGKVGLVEAANGGTLFLDEIGILPQNLQSKFLQLVQEKTFLPVGGVKQKSADVRIISATNLDLKKQVEEGLFREDLYYRLRVIEFYMPPLRERTDALEPLIDHFVNYYNQKYHIAKEISPNAREILKHHSWSGNVRELQYVIERVMVTSADNYIDSEDIPPLREVENAEDEHHSEEINFEQSVEAYEKKLLRQAYQKHKSSYKVADALGISQTKASRLLRKYEIS